MRYLSSFLQSRAENAHDGRIPDETRRFISQVAAAEREMARDEDPAERLLAEIAEQTQQLTRQVAFYTRAQDHIAFLCRHAEKVPAYAEALPAERETKVRAESEIVEATHLLEDLLRGLRLHVRPLPNAMHTLSHLKEGAA